MQTIDRIQQRQLERLTPTDEESLAQYRRVVGGALEVMIGRPLPTDGDVEFETLEKEQLGDYKRYVGLLKQKVHGEELPIIFLHPNDWNGKVVVWATDQGKAGIYNDKGQPVAAIRKLLKEGSALAAADLLYQGELVGAGGPLRQTRVVKNPRQFLGYTVGYNHPLFAQRVHDLLSIVAFCKYHPDQPMEIHLVGRGMAGPWAAAASAIAGQVVDRTVVGHADFRFAGITDIRDLNLLPGAVKCGDLPGMLALIAPRPLRLEGVKEVPALTAAAYKAAGASGKVKAS